MRKNFHKPEQETTVASAALEEEEEGWDSAPRNYLKKVCVYKCACMYIYTNMTVR